MKNVQREGLKAAGRRQEKGQLDLYLFPDPGLLRPKFYENWLLSRPAWVWRASQRQPPAKLLSPAMWRECLFYGLATGKSNLRPGTKEFEKVDQMANAFGYRLDNSGNLTVPGARAYPMSGTDGGLKWKGNSVAKKPDGSLDDQVVREMLWELYELSFRLELLALDKRMSRAETVDEVLDRQEKVNLCFAGGHSKNFMLFPPEIPVANAGLASDSIEGRRPFVVALARLMTGWKVRIPNVIQQQDNLSEDGVAALESTVAAFYCQTFYDVRERAPLTPHRLH